jgi:putative Mg2+ transporter-C (MgtC) family protein
MGESARESIVAFRDSDGDILEHQLSLTEVHALTRLLFGAALGALIGLERQWRQRMSGGLQTCALVAGGATLYTVITNLVGPGVNPLQIAGQVVTGIGFLAGGVILKEGMNVRGLNTAATIWSTAAVGCLAGLGFFVEAAAGMVAIASLNWFLSPVADALDRRGGKFRRTRYQIEVVCRDEAEAAVNALVVDAADEAGLTLAAKTIDHGAELGTLRFNAQLTGRRQDHGSLQHLVGNMRALPGVISAKASAHEISD